jgi:hypothetical protein
MPFKDEAGKLNNFAKEPKMYGAEPPTAAQKRNYVLMGFGAMALVGGLTAIAFSIQ